MPLMLMEWEMLKTEEMESRRSVGHVYQTIKKRLLFSLDYYKKKRERDILNERKKTLEGEICGLFTCMQIDASENI